MLFTVTEDASEVLDHILQGNGRDRAVKKVALGPLQIIPKSDATKEHLRGILRYCQWICN